MTGNSLGTIVPRSRRGARPVVEPGPHAQRTRAIIAAGKLTLTQLERRDLAELLTGHTGTWATISEDDARRIADALDAFLAVQALLLLRRQGARR